MLNEILESCKNDTCCIETDVKQEIIREGIFTYRSKSVKHDKIYLSRIP